MQASEALKYFRLLDFFQAEGGRALPPLLWARGFLPGPSLDPLALGHSALRLLYSKVCRPECWRDKYIHLYLESGETELEDGTVENK